MAKKIVTLDYSVKDKFYYISDNKIRHVVVERIDIRVFFNMIEINYQCKTTDGKYSFAVGDTTLKYDTLEEAKLALAKNILGNGYKIEKL